MNEDCERVQLSIMAIRDGEEAPLGHEKIREHLDACSSCRAEVTVDDALQARLLALARRIPEADLWGPIERRIVSPASGRPATRALIAAGILLAVIRAACLVASPGLAWMGSVLALGAVAAVFLLMRENPFRIAST